MWKTHEGDVPEPAQFGPVDGGHPAIVVRTRKEAYGVSLGDVGPRPDWLQKWILTNHKIWPIKVCESRDTVSKTDPGGGLHHNKSNPIYFNQKPTEFGQTGDS